MDDKWRMVGCTSCSGYGIRAYGLDPLPEECSECWGKGFLYIRPQGHLFQYPGGPAAGKTTADEYNSGRIVQLEGSPA